ncbi:MAG: NAD-dependent deacetylase [Acidobacteriota bacterium]|nr:MAG: NAD-dependent deacetylase [Acidobacteriota bacterium]
MEHEITRASLALKCADALLITAGAGVGVDSGLPDFRGTQGFWKAYPPIAKLGLSFAEMANPTWFQKDPGLAWAFYGHRLNLYRRTVPHEGIRNLLEWADSLPAKYFVFTSNVDGQFQKAGCSPERIEECHGSIHLLQCAKPCGQAIWDAGSIEIEIDEDRFRALPPLPLCPQCGGMARPNILMFGDWAWNSENTDQQSRRLTRWLSETVPEVAGKLAVVELGAGKAVPTVRHMSEHLAHRMKAPLIRINPRDPEVPDSFDISLPLGAKEGILRILAAV